MAPAASREEPIGLLAVVGPTGIGKTALAVALARDCPIEVVSVDSRQVYRRMDIGTGKPTAAERAAVPHHLIDVAEPDEPYDAARFARDAARAIADIRGRGRRPVLVGGTGLYLRALLRGLAPRPSTDPSLRRRLRAEALAAGPAALHRRLEALDPAAARALHPRDVVRVTRALEVVTLTGRPVSSEPHTWQSAVPRYRTLLVGLTMERSVLSARLDARVDRMMAAGLLEEVRGLLAAGLSLDLPAMHGIGYRHLAPVLTGGARLEDAVRAMKRDTRRYAKRQETWFAREAVAWLAAEGREAAELVAGVKQLLERASIFG